MQRVFARHATADRTFVETDLLPLRREYSLEPWYAPDDIETASDWEERKRVGLESCEWLLMDVSRSAVASK
jgi:hypothetical protein